jgi:hypothetical protein
MIDLWPKDIEYTELRAPATIIKEQASLLGQKTKNLLKAEVLFSKTLETQDSFYYTFYFVAPTLNNYRYKLFTISHGIKLYPVEINIDYDINAEISPQEKDGNLVAHSEDEFLEILHKIFNADTTKQIMKSILAQTNFNYDEKFINKP